MYEEGSFRGLFHAYCGEILREDGTGEIDWRVVNGAYVCRVGVKGQL